MMTKTNTLTAQIPSTFGMPAYACAPSARTAVIALAPTSGVVGDKSALRGRPAVVAADLGLGQATVSGFPGTSAWRPPIS